MPAPIIFKDPSVQALFEKQGFVVIPSFLNKEEVQYMDALFDELHPNLPENGFFAGVYSSDFDYKKRVSEEVKVVYNRAYENTFVNYTSFGGAFLHKVSAPDSDLFVHQDWTVVEEDEHVALNIWVPLCDITPNNGPLMVLPGSQYDSFNVLRAPTMRFFFDHDSKAVIDQLEPLIVNAGDAVVLNQSLVHYSPPNVSGKIRKAITAGLKTKDAQMIFHFKDPNATDNTIEKFEMDDDFFIHFDNFFEDIYKRPTVGKSIGTINYSVPMLLGNELNALIRKMKSEAGFEYFESNAESEINADSEVQIETSKPSFMEIYTPKNIWNELKLRFKK
jgi:hypothetical protein